MDRNLDFEPLLNTLHKGYVTLLYIFSVKYHFYEISSEANLSRLWLPAITLGIISALPLIRMIRANMLSEFGQIYIVSALSRGLTRKYIISHALRNALILNGRTSLYYRQT